MPPAPRTNSAPEGDEDAARALRLQRAAPAWAWELDLRGGGLWLSPPLREAAGLDGGPGPARLADLAHAADRDALERACAAALDGREPLAAEFRLLTAPRGGQPPVARWVRAEGCALPGADGRPAWLTGVLADADAARRDRRLLARLQRSMAASGEAWFERTAGLDDAAASENLMRLLGHPPGTPLPDLATFLGWVHPDDATRLRELIRRAAQEEGDWELTYRVRGADGEHRWMRGRGRSTRDAAGRIVMSGLLGDVHEQVLAREELQQHREHLAELVSERTVRLQDALAEAQQRRLEADRANEAKSRFLAHMSHEMRTPLNGLLGLVELALRGAESPTQRRHLEVASQSGQALLQTINDVLDFSRLRAALPAPAETDFDLAELLAEVVRGVMPLVRHKGLSVRFDWEGEATWVRSDPTRVRQIATNLVGNAAKFTASGHIALRASLLPGPRGLVLRALVEDSGPGLAPGVQSAVFEPFFQADASLTRRHGGTGLGLTIARGLARSLGGDVTLERSAPGQGSSFLLSLGLVAVPDPAPAPRPPPGHAWLVYTQAEIGAWLQRRLARLDWTADVVPGIPAAAAGAAGGAAPALVVLAEHVLLPGSDLLGLRRALPQARITLLVRPDWNQPALEAEARAAGMDISVMPVTPRDLQLMTGGAVSLPASPESVTPARGAARVLLAEDNEINRMIAAEFLQALGRPWRGAANGREAVEACLAEPPSLVLMDLQMPVMDGFDATRTLRTLQREGRLPGFPVVALTAHAQPADRDQALAAGMDDFLTKPLRLETLREVLDRLAPLG